MHQAPAAAVAGFIRSLSYYLLLSSTRIVLEVYTAILGGMVVVVAPLVVSVATTNLRPPETSTGHQYGHAGNRKQCDTGGCGHRNRTNTRQKEGERGRARARMGATATQGQPDLEDRGHLGGRVFACLPLVKGR